MTVDIGMPQGTDQAACRAKRGRGGIPKWHLHARTKPDAGPSRARRTRTKLPPMDVGRRPQPDSSCLVRRRAIEGYDPAPAGDLRAARSGRIHISRARQDSIGPSPDLGPRPLALEPSIGAAAARDGAEIALLDLVELDE
jgi:hypothetical protein